MAAQHDPYTAAGGGASGPQADNLLQQWTPSLLVLACMLLAGISTWLAITTAEIWVSW